MAIYKNPEYRTGQDAAGYWTVGLRSRESYGVIFAFLQLPRNEISLNAHLRSPFNFPSETYIEMAVEQVKSWCEKGQWLGNLSRLNLHHHPLHLLIWQSRPKHVIWTWFDVKPVTRKMWAHRRFAEMLTGNILLWRRQNVSPILLSVCVLKILKNDLMWAVNVKTAF